MCSRKLCEVNYSKFFQKNNDLSTMRQKNVPWNNTPHDNIIFEILVKLLLSKMVHPCIRILRILPWMVDWNLDAVFIIGIFIHLVCTKMFRHWLHVLLHTGCPALQHCIELASALLVKFLLNGGGQYTVRITFALHFVEVQT